MKVIWDMVTGEYEERSPGAEAVRPASRPVLPTVGDFVEPRLVPVAEEPRVNRHPPLPGIRRGR